VIESARKAAAVYAQSLPDYIVKRTTARYRSATQTNSAADARSALSTRIDPGAGTSGADPWQPIDTISGDVTVERGREVYTNVRVNGNPAKYLPPGGSWSAGEFSGQMLIVLAPEREAQFTHPHAESLRGRPSVRYDFTIDQAHSAWNMAAANTGYARSDVDYSPAYTGRIWIDKETGQALSIEMSARGLPSGFPVATIDSRTDYDFVKIGDARFLLPVHSQTLSCEPGGRACLKNETDFRDFRKFESNTNITFDQPK